MSTAVIGPRVTPALMNTLTDRFRRAISGEFRADEFSRGLYSTDASIYQMAPVGIVAPRSSDDVVATVSIAREFGLPIVPRGGGTSLSGQSIGPGLILDFSRFMNSVLEIDPDRRLAKIQPGVVLDQLNHEVKRFGYQFGPDVATSSRANLGGMIGNNSAGSRSVRQGKTIDHLRELQLVLSSGERLRTRPLSASEIERLEHNGSSEGRLISGFRGLVEELSPEIARKFPRILRRVSGYNLAEFVPRVAAELPRPWAVETLDREWPDRADFNLTRLFVGAEGTLGIITEAVVHLVPLPRERAVVAIEFETLDAALEVVPTILATEPSAVEVLDHNIVRLSRANLKYKSSLDFVEGTPEAILIVEWTGDRPEIVRDLEQLLADRLKGATGLTKWHRAETAERRDALWNCRKAGAPLLLSIPGARKPIAFVEDTAVEPVKLPEFTRRFRKILDRHGLTGAYYGHASVGCLHIRPMVDTKSAGDRQALKAVSDDVANLVQEFGGAMTGEHGDGLARSYHNLKLFGPTLFEGFRRVKTLFDPAGLMNPGKIVASPSPIDNLRTGPNYHPLPIATLQTFDREERLQGYPGGGLLAAAEMCNGAGVCRKTLTGTMCPSYMATKDEEQSTRARANALRLALSGQLAEGALTSRRMYDVFEMCLMCKACKAECPSNVDVAKMKVEFLARYREAHGIPVSARLLANVAWLNRLGSATAPVSNWIANFPGIRQLNAWLLGIDARRQPPRFERDSFQRWFDRRPQSRDGCPRDLGRVVVLDDCLTSHCEPGISRSAVELLEAAGYQVERAGLWCCGRPLISKGLVTAARTLAARNITRLIEHVRSGALVVGVEPSCVMTFIEEYPDLVPSDAARELRDSTFLVDEVLSRPEPLARLGERLAAVAAAPSSGVTDTATTVTEILLHGHCQQKALRGTAATKRLLSVLPGFSVREVDSGCCGMAGAFGYEHHDVSMKMGERVLFPTVRAAEGPIVAPGFSCRHQVKEGAGRTAVHPVELVAERLEISRNVS